MDAATQARVREQYSCRLCRHFHRETVTCEAFPRRIPIQIISGEISHFEPFPGDNGIQFELRDES